MKKGDEIRKLFRAKVAVLIEKDGVLHAYMSHVDFPNVLPQKLKACHKKTPEDYITVAQLKSAQSLSTQENEAEDEAEDEEGLSGGDKGKNDELLQVDFEAQTMTPHSEPVEDRSDSKGNAVAVLGSYFNSWH